MKNAWSNDWNEGIRYLEVCKRAFPAKKTFTPEILYNMTGMAIEKMFVAYCVSRGTLPENHTIHDLVRAADAIESLPAQLRDDLLNMDRFMNLCSLIPAPAPVPTAADVPEFLDVSQRVQLYVEKKLGIEAE